MRFKIGDRIQHPSGTGPIFEIIKLRPEYDDALACTSEVQPSYTRVIYEENWRVVPQNTQFLVHFYQVNATRIEVSAASREDAEASARKVWKRDNAEPRLRSIEEVAE